MRKKSKTGTVVFYSIYAFFVLLILVAVFILLNKLTVYLDNYERSLEKYEAQEVFEEYFSPCRFDKLYDMQTIEMSEFENKEAFIKYMEDQIAGKNITYREVSAGLSGGKKYHVLADKVKFSEFTLVKNTDPAIPEDTWKLDSVTTVYTKTQSAKVKILTTSKLYVNDIEPSDTYITTDGITTDSCRHMPEGVPGILYREYELKNLLLAPKLKTVDRYGNESTLVYDEDSQAFIEQINYDVLTDKIKTLTENAAQTYAKYMTLDSTLYNVSKYFDTASNIYYNIRISDTRWYTPHISYEFKDTEIKEYYIYDENTYSVRYSCNHYVYRTKNDPHLFPLDLTLYFKNINGQFYVYDMVSNY